MLRAHAALVLLLATATVSAVAGCDGDGGPGPALVTTALTTTTVPRGNVDGVLTIGVLLPETGQAAPLGPPMVKGIELAVKEINEAGGVNGHPVVMVEQDEGDTLASASTSLDALLEADVDAVIGPASSTVALALIDRVAEAGVLTCSPATTAIALTTQADRGLFFRTMPSDELAGVAMAQAIAATGRRTTAVLYPDDEYGRQFLPRLQQELATKDVQINATEPYDPSAASYAPVVSRVLQSDPQSLAVIGLADQGGRLLAALNQQGRSPLFLSTFVSDGMRRADLSEKVQPGRPVVVSGLHGTAPAILPTASSWFLDAWNAFTGGITPAYAAYAYDCANLIALSSVAAGTDDPAAVASHMEETSRFGVVCRNFPDCAGRVKAGLNVDLDGASGPIDFSPRGDPTAGRYDEFSFDASGRELVERQLDVSLP